MKKVGGERNKRVILGMSGGVDSSVAAAILKDEGFDVIGVLFDMLGSESKGEGDSGIDAARRVTEKLEIPIKVIPVKKNFDETVVGYFIKEYMAGKTPNTCVVCNRDIKFRYLLEISKEEKAELVATGHYARVSFDNGRYILMRGKDASRDQSYFLSFVGQDELKKTLFPLGDMTKGDVDALADKIGLPCLRTESREICFLRGGDYRRYLEDFLGGTDTSGEIVDRNGKIIGMHDGYFNFTVGQRRGISLPSSEPYYVLNIDPENKRVVVGRREDLMTREVSARDFNWISERPKEDRIKAKAMVRYNQSPAPGVATITDDGDVSIEFSEPQFAPASGQALVLYDGDVVLGGGFIV